MLTQTVRTDEMEVFPEGYPMRHSHDVGLLDGGAGPDLDGTAEQTAITLLGRGLVPVPTERLGGPRHGARQVIHRKPTGHA